MSYPPVALNTTEIRVKLVGIDRSLENMLSDGHKRAAVNLVKGDTDFVGGHTLQKLNHTSHR